MDGLTTKIKVGIEEIILILLIAMSVIGILYFLPGDVMVIKKLIAWIGMGYLFYKIDLSELFFGKKSKLVDGLLIFAYFCLILKDFFTFSKELTKESFYLFDFNLLFQKSIALGGKIYLLKFPLAETIEIYGFYLGAAILICLALSQLLFKTEIVRPSILGLFHEGMPSSFGVRFVRVFTSFFVFLAFFMIVFNLVMEWLAWVIKSWIIFFAVFFYLFFFIKYHKQFHVSTIIYKVGDIGHSFYHRFLDLFKERRTVFLGVSGMLVLHLLTDIGTFIIPYLVGKNVSYFASFGPSHDSLFSLLLIDVAGATVLWQKIGIVALYVLNALAILFLFFGPVYIWRLLYKEERIPTPKLLLALFYPAALAFILSPIFKITRIQEGQDVSIVGVDILTHGVVLSDLLRVLFLVIGLAVLIAILLFIPKLSFFLTLFMIVGVQFFLGYYIFLYFMSVAQSYLLLLSSPGLPTLFIIFFALFFLIAMLFYSSGFLSFIFMSWRRIFLDIKQSQ
ncbi:hypothetical protein HY488_03140 [Candidatus Woesearchaeota archaeon]|nr:hypothetical protein [Candidatus Woesearchaeota archaeon]